ncbi:hypothetical protein [Sphingomonas crocodyli]|uniref:Uncharacterized protein n=1 Tax=Sphingomonas crocodyli TaxID=1979270 RepID=A0A437M6A9_9SPHN|nr:hypothetical protein [Sphingomonas crocodyli]RVT93095.1 hypothetical protein EOD43_04140 [Sphingomonas crocodyli]
MRPRRLWVQLVAIIVEQAIVLLVPTFVTWWIMWQLGCTHMIAALFAFFIGFVIWAAVWSAGEVSDQRE